MGTITWSQSGCCDFTRNTRGAPNSLGFDSEVWAGPSADGVLNTFTDGTDAVATTVFFGAGATVVVGAAVEGNAAGLAVAPPAPPQPAEATTTAKIAAHRCNRISRF
jgi:hypothetical protein